MHSNIPPSTHNGFPVANPKPTAEDPDKTMAIVALCLLSVPIPFVSVVLSAIALRKSKQRGYKNTLALVGLIMSAIGMVVVTLALFVFIAAARDGTLEIDSEYRSPGSNEPIKLEST